MLPTMEESFVHQKNTLENRKRKWYEYFLKRFFYSRRRFHIYIYIYPKVDIYSLGNILYMLLQEEWPFGDVKSADAQEMIRKGGRPSIYIDIWNSTDPVTVLLKKAMFRCHEQEPKDRWTARQVEQFLNQGLQQQQQQLVQA
jgi:serine/threonine protein kinase